MVKKRYYIVVFITVLILLCGYLHSSIGNDSGIDGLHIPVRFEPNSVDINHTGLYQREGTSLHISKVTDYEINDWLYNDPDTTTTKLDNGMFRVRDMRGYYESETIHYWELVEYKNTYYIVDVGKDIDLNMDMHSYVNTVLSCEEELPKVLDEFNSMNNVEPLVINI